MSTHNAMQRIARDSLTFSQESKLNIDDQDNTLNNAKSFLKLSL